MTTMTPSQHHTSGHPPWNKGHLILDTNKNCSTCC